MRLVMRLPAAGPERDVPRGDSHAAAAHAEAGVRGSGAELPHIDAIQRSFGHHDVRGVRAHLGGDARAAARDIGAQAYAMGNDVAFAATPDLRTAAHEAAHAVQQRSGLVGGGLGREGDAHERHADAVAEQVVRGASAEHLLASYARAGGHAQSPAVQRIPTNYGEFKDESYTTVKDAAGKEVGVDMYLKFKPNANVDAKSIGMTQAVRTVVDGKPIAINNDDVIKSRMIKAADAIKIGSPVKDTDEGMQIDQLSAYRNPLYATGAAPAANADKLTSYATPSPVTAMTPAEKTANTFSGVNYKGWGEHGYHYMDGAALKEKNAELHDTPMKPDRGNKAEQLFETTAVAIDGQQTGTYYGSVEWGWRTDDKGAFTQIPLTSKSQGAPTSTFLKAAEIWNAGKNTAGDANVKLPTVEVYLVDNAAGVELNKDMPGPWRDTDKLPKGTRLIVKDWNKGKSAGAEWVGKVKVEVADGALIGKGGWIKEADIKRER